jgi:ABC-type transporter Mla subunit MlaD
MIEANKFRLGMFVIAAVTLFFAVIFVFGLSDVFEKKARFVTLFQESVQGIAVGTPVKYKGVPIGSVSDISIAINENLIRVDMDIELKAFTGESNMPMTKALDQFYDFFKKERSKGLRCRLEYAGITGLKYIELDYYIDSASNIITEPNNISKTHFYVPAQPSMFKDILKLINTSLEKISRVPFDKISDEMTETLKSMQRLLDDPKLKNTIEKMEKMSDNLEKSTSSISNVFTENKLREIVDGLNSNLKTINALATDARKDLQNAQIPETSKSFRNAADSVNEVKQSLQTTINKIDQTIDSLNELVNYLNDDPSALVRGKQKQPVLKPVKRP